MTVGTKLSILSHTRTQTYVNNIVVDTWKDLNIFHVKVDSSRMNNEQAEELSNVLEKHAIANGFANPVILVGDSFEIEIYCLGEVNHVSDAQLQLEFEDAS